MEPAHQLGAPPPLIRCQSGPEEVPCFRRAPLYSSSLGSGRGATACASVKNERPPPGGATAAAGGAASAGGAGASGSNAAGNAGAGSKTAASATASIASCICDAGVSGGGRFSGG